MAATRETVTLKTPQGHDVLAEMDYEHFEVRRAKVVHSYTGVIKALDSEISENLARAIQAKKFYEQALVESRAVEQTLEGFGEAVMKLGPNHPALKPYWQEMEKHRSVAEDMSDRAAHFQSRAMQAIDKIVEG